MEGFYSGIYFIILACVSYFKVNGTLLLRSWLFFSKQTCYTYRNTEKGMKAAAVFIELKTIG
ncbi:hypothetical protein CJ483_07090 [Bacillus sp. PK3_68]|nr:hypothetical protein CJ483_07090 [Bacillus sp. PK3_68]